MAIQMFTRSVTTYSIKAYKIAWENGQPIAKKIGDIQADGTFMSNTVARKLLKNAGVDCPRGTQIQIEPIETKQYGMTVDEFMQHAKVIE